MERSSLPRASAATLGLAMTLAAVGCASAGTIRSTTPGSGRHAETGERRSASRSALGYADVATGGGGGSIEIGSATTTSAGVVTSAEPAAESLASYSFESEGDSDDAYRGEELPPPSAPGSSPRPDVTVARLLEEGAGGEAYADAGRRTASAGDVAAALAETATDASPGGALLIYRASVWLGVYEVRESQAALALRAEELGGFVQHQTDTELTLRVPAAQFDALLEAATSAGDLLHREVAADDVSEEYRDVEIRIQNLEAMRERLEVLLTQATAVEDALRVERELERVTVELERLRGRQRFLSDRIALATITIHFEARPRDRIDQPEIFALPFYWLQNLGLPNLLSLH